ncbi:DUF4239 domain-containing protein [Allorhizocola rhizosphaerae]|uniref:bestrophin-like domain n=1 Tax=Allorhizocola rhizosphaerae TaxID=1872709 RepID=UPI000E3BCDE4|nr:DUF4239 domain-containing protein [Allorhizocola rhizosphaerae]
MLTPLLIVVGTVVVVGIGLLVVRRVIPGEAKQPHHDVAAAIFSMVGVLYAVILAFVVIVVWENHNGTGAEANVEANEVSRLYFTARALPEPQRKEMMELARDYAGTVAGEEWALMAQGQSSPKARAQVARMRVVVQGMQPTTARDEILMSNSLDAINALVDARRARTGALTSPVSPIMWIGLIAGSVITVAFTFIFDHSRYLLHLLMVGSMAALIAFTLWIVRDLSLPFAGLNAIGPDAFTQVLQRFREFPP